MRLRVKSCEVLEKPYRAEGTIVKKYKWCLRCMSSDLLDSSMKIKKMAKREVVNTYNFGEIW